VSAKTQAYARRYIELGYAPIPVPPGSKNPNRRGWEHERHTLEDVPRCWNNGQGIGLLTGPASGWLVDVDLDVLEAVSIAGRFLQPTRTSGHGEHLESHWWYYAEGARTRDYLDTDGKKKLIELRARGRQTLVAPSLHPDGEEYAWKPALEVATVGASELQQAVNALATATLIARYLPEHRRLGGGGRHDYALALAGYMLRDNRLDRETVLSVLRAAWDAKGWPSEQDRREAHRDLERAVEDTAWKLAHGKKVKGGRKLEEMEPGMAARIADYWEWDEQDEGEHEEEERKPTQAELLIRCAEGVEFFHTPAGDAYARIKVGDHRETHPLRSKGFRRYLVRDFFDRHGRPPGAQALQDALGLLEARAQFDGPEREVHVRVAEHGGNIYVDLANERWEAVEITPGAGWRVVSEPPVCFRRPRGMLPLPIPSRSGLVRELRRFVNIRDEDEASWRLLAAWLVQAFRPKGLYPVLILQGEQGSAKSTVERLLRALLDPSTAPLRDEKMRRTGIIQSERQVFELAREHFNLNEKGGAA
jgi:Bifunctional DNA primase/polymerase, N-terminal